MTVAPVLHGAVAGGHLLWAEHERALRRIHLGRLEGHPVDIVIRRHQSQRSRAQNNYLHAVVAKTLSEHFGYTVAEIKLILLGQCFGWRLDPLSGREIPVKLHTAELTVEECTEFIDWVIPWAQIEHGVSIPLPDEAVA